MSETRIRANRENARKSTGPRSLEGKARSSKNATRHGLTKADAATVSPARLVVLLEALVDAFPHLDPSDAQTIAGEMAHAALIRDRRRRIMGDALPSPSHLKVQTPSKDNQLSPPTRLLELPRLADYERKSASRLRNALKAAAQRAATRAEPH